MNISDLYFYYGIIGYGEFVLDSGYELTKEDVILSYQNDVNLGQFFEGTLLETLLTMMFQKDLSLITYGNLSSVQGIEIDELGT